MDRNPSGGDVEAVLGETLRSHAELAPPAHALLDAVTSKVHRRRAVRRRAVTLGVAGAVVLAGATGAIVAAGPGGGGRTIAGRAILGETRVWNFHGLQVNVPGDWAVNAVTCGRSMRDTVVIDQGPVPACASNGGPVVQSVTFAGAPDHGAASRGSRPVVVDGKQGTVSTGRLPGGLTHEVLVVPELDASVDIRTKSADLAARIVASARVATVDPNGCASQVVSLHPKGRPDRSGASARLVPGRPSSATVCHYDGGRLGHSTQLDDGEITELRSLLNGLHPGLKRSGSATPEFCVSADQEGFVLRFGYPSGPPLTVYVHLQGCDRLGADSGARTGGLTASFGDAFTEKFDAGFGSVIAGDLN